MRTRGDFWGRGLMIGQGKGVGGGAPCCPALPYPCTLHSQSACTSSANPLVFAPLSVVAIHGRCHDTLINAELELRLGRSL